MLDTDSKTYRAQKAAIEAEADAELAEIYGGAGMEEELVFRSKWYASGVWPFRRISFECPGCSRWLSVSSSHSGRVGMCPSCRLTLSAPDIGGDLPAALVSKAKEVPALPARHLPHQQRARTVPAPERGGGGDGASAVRSPRSDCAPELNRFGSVGEEGEWGMRPDERMVPVAVVTRLQTIKPWLGIAALVIAAVVVARAFMASQTNEGMEEIPSIYPQKKEVRIPLSSELWVVLDALTTATTPEEISTMVRRPGEMLPKMQAYYAANRDQITLPHRFERARPGLKLYEIGGTRFARFEGRCDGRPVKFSFEGTQHGWRLDWESLVGYSDVNWPEYLASRPPGEQFFRVLAEVSTDALLEYDRERYICMHLVDHLETGDAFALVDRHGTTAAKLGKFFKLHARGGSPRTWITPVLVPVEGSDELFEIVGIKSGSWLIP